MHPATEAAIPQFEAAIIGPGSFYTSLMPIFLVQGAPDAIRQMQGPIVLVTNLLTEGRGMTGFTAGTAVELLARTIGRPIDVVIVNTSRPSAATLARYRPRAQSTAGDWRDPGRDRARHGRALVRRHRASRSAPAGAGGLGSARPPVVVTLLHLQRAALAFGHLPLFEGADLRIEAGERIALIGRNGSGKSSLLRVLSGELPPDSGVVWRTPSLRVSRLDQDVPGGIERTVFDEIADGLGVLGALVADYHHAAVGWRNSRTTPTRCQPSRGSSSGWSARMAGGSSRKSSW